MNPEFRRQLWLECTPHRVITLLLALAAVFTLAGLVDPQGLGGVVRAAALMSFVVITVAYGAHRAGESLLEELRERTWDTQRMSALSPWRMTWGKLFGASSMAWIAGASCLAVYAIAATRDDGEAALATVLLAVAGALLVQALALVGALTIAPRARRAKASMGGRIAAVLAALVWAYFALLTREADRIVWFGQTFPKQGFLAVAVASLAAWAVLGASRMMSEELQVATRPWAWPLFLGFLTVLIGGGFIGGGEWPALRVAKLLSALGLAIALVATYVTAFALHRDPLIPRILRVNWRRRDWRALAESLPLALVSLACATLAALACMLLAATPDSALHRVENVDWAALPLLLYTVRDVLILFALGIGQRAERAELGALIDFALLYWLVPAIFETVGLGAVAAVLRPPLWERPLLASLILAVHVAVCAGWAGLRYTREVAPRVQTAPA